MPKGPLPPFDGSDNSYFENMTKSVFIMGFSREVVLSKWDGFREVFDDFNINKISKWQEGDILEAVEDARIIRNMKKIEATVENANKLQKLQKEHGSITSYLEKVENENEDFQKRLKIIAKNFKMMGPKATHLFLWLSHRPTIDEMKE